MAKQGNHQGIIGTTQDAVADVAKTTVEGAKAIAGSAFDTANNAALAATGTVLKAVRSARKMVAAPKRRRKAAKTSARRSPTRRAAGRRAAVTRNTKTNVRRKATIARKKMRAMPRRKRR